MKGARRAERSRSWRVVGWLAIVLVLVIVLVPVGALTFSVKVSGRSMSPTLEEGDRLLMDVVHRHEIRRFDLVEASFGQGSFRVVKRVIGVPGDRVRIEILDGSVPRVTLRPAGSSRTYVVRNQAWVDQVGSAITPCCDERGREGLQARWTTIPKASYWLLGDNWGGSEDSRKFGFVAAADIGARLNIRLTPFGRAGSVPQSVRLAPAD
ncbi:signal peptidase I [Nocardioides marmoriginsengisoli]|uniref:Signal peptidase I n=1 Tax=Nocardioides marmoriginsengisoli TaxID=661483 RepID=A0A3N0CNZ0_9ACTN|nr:signal peptidase I [Nocardioides marmoriginsengisoli]RNL65070.1 signal peptidase I [Nocardioides marmoriginsengisoli]